MNLHSSDYESAALTNYAISPEIIEAVSSVSGIVEIPLVTNICRTRTEVKYTIE